MFGGSHWIVTGLIEHINADFDDDRSTVTKLNQIPHIRFEVDRTIAGKHKAMIRRRSDRVLDMNENGPGHKLFHRLAHVQPKGCEVTEVVDELEPGALDLGGQPEQA